MPTANFRISIIMAQTSIINTGTRALIVCTCEIGELGQITAAVLVQGYFVLCFTRVVQELDR